MKFFLIVIDPIVIKTGFVILPLPPIGSQQKFRKGDIIPIVFVKKGFLTQNKNPFFLRIPLIRINLHCILTIHKEALWQPKENPLAARVS